MRAGVKSPARNVPITRSSNTDRFTRCALGRAAVPPFTFDEQPYERPSTIAYDAPHSPQRNSPLSGC
jgi:hypothetical protein